MTDEYARRRHGVHRKNIYTPGGVLLGSAYAIETATHRTAPTHFTVIGYVPPPLPAHADNPDPQWGDTPLLTLQRGRR